MKLEGVLENRGSPSMPKTEKVNTEEPWCVILMDNDVFIYWCGVRKGAVVMLQCLSS